MVRHAADAQRHPPGPAIGGQLRCPGSVGPGGREHAGDGRRTRLFRARHRSFLRGPGEPGCQIDAVSPTPATPPARSRFRGDSRYGPLPALLLALTTVTGLVDAVSILRLGRVFVANMTGNVVFTGFALTGAPGFSLSASLFALAGFLAGRSEER